jgi:hypothetical protein
MLFVLCEGDFALDVLVSAIQASADFFLCPHFSKMHFCRSLSLIVPVLGSMSARLRAGTAT